MKINVLGFDPGYGDIKEAFRDDTGKIVKQKYSSIIATAPDAALDMPHFEGKRFYMGKDALTRSSDEIIEINDYMSLEKAVPLFLWKTIKRNEIDIDALKYIVLGLSFSQSEKGPEFLKRLSRFRINGESFNFQKKLLMTPQGVGAKYAIDHFFPDAPDAYMIIDIGLSTIDTVDSIGGIVRPENVHGYRDEGIIKIVRNLQHYIAKEFNEQISLKEVKELLESKSFFLEGEDHDLTDVIKKFSSEYTEMTLKTLRERFSREFKKYRKIYFVGGGAYFIDPSVSKIIEVLPEPEYYNAVGNLLKGEKELEKA